MLTAELIAPIATTASTNIALIVPVGITILGLIIGVSLIPKIIYKFL